MSQEKYDGESLSVFDQAFDRGYKQGYRHGAEDEKNAEIWHVSEVVPEAGELVQAAVLPYDWRTRRMCRRKKIKWILTNGVFLSGRKLWEETHEPDEPWDEEEWNDWILVSPRKAVAWKDAVLLWHSAEVPEWFVEKYKGEGDV